MQLLVNRKVHEVAPEWQQETLLSVLHEHLGLVGAKFGCGVGLCGSCVVLVDAQAQRSCLLSVAQVGARQVTTIEGLEATATAGRSELHPVQQAWLDEAVAQCGYCQAGQIMAAVALLCRVPRPNDVQIDEAFAGHLCRCGTQQRIRRAVHRAAAAST
jgi:isoquinoline 1-oxidoreductase alpha subunit